MSTTPNDEKFDYPASPVVDELKHSDLSHADEGYQTYVTTADTVPVDEEESKRIARMLDWRLLPLSELHHLLWMKGGRGKGCILITAQCACCTVFAMWTRRL